MNNNHLPYSTRNEIILLYINKKVKSLENNTNKVNLQSVGFYGRLLRDKGIKVSPLPDDDLT